MEWTSRDAPWRLSAIAQTHSYSSPSRTASTQSKSGGGDEGRARAPPPHSPAVLLLLPTLVGPARAPHGLRKTKEYCRTATTRGRRPTERAAGAKGGRESVSVRMVFCERRTGSSAGQSGLEREIETHHIMSSHSVEGGTVRAPVRRPAPRSSGRRQRLSAPSTAGRASPARPPRRSSRAACPGTASRQSPSSA